MLAMIPFPEIDPRAFHFEAFGREIALRWYALAYIVGILIGWRLAVRLLKTPRLWPSEKPPFTVPQVEDFLSWVILGVVLGGRLGFVIFYRPFHYMANPVEIIQVWDGGMSFHGGFLGVVLVTYLYCRKHSIPLLSAADMLAICTPPALLLGRIANFINAELWGRPTDVPWAVKFPTLCQSPEIQLCPVAGDWFYNGNELPRHPSQLYEAGLEGLVLGALLLYLAYRVLTLHRPGYIAGVFFAGYGIARYIVEFFRQADQQFITPDNPIGYVTGHGAIGVTQGQLLSLPMIVIGLVLITWALRRKPV